MTRSDLGFTASDSLPFAWAEIRSLGVATLVWASLAAAASATVAAFAIVVRHELTDTLGTGAGMLTVGAALVGIAAATAALILVRTKVRSLAAARAALLALAVTMLAVAWTTSTALLVVLLAAAGAAAGVAATVVTPAVADAYPPVSRVTGIATVRAAELAGVAAVLLAQTIATVPFDLTWRSLAVGAAFLAAVAAAAVAGEEPAAGQWDEQRIRVGIVPVDARGTLPAHLLTAGESVRRTLEVATARRLVAANAAFGVLLVPVLVYGLYHLDEAHSLASGSATLALGAALLVAAVGTRVAANAVNRMFLRAPDRAVAFAAMATGGCGAALVVAVFVPTAAAEAVVMALAFGLLGVARTIADAIAMSVVPADLRRVMSALNVASLAVGAALAAPLLLAGMDRRFGPTGAVVTGALFAGQAAAALRAAGRTAAADIDRRAAVVTEEAELSVTRHAGGHVPLLACRGLDFAYGHLQVLFGVDFTVDAGEMVALLGTNGAGKSTLLRLISGLALASNGTIRLDGADITYLDAERRTRLGVSQVPGGRGVYPQLSVIENLRVIGFTAGRDGQRLAHGIDAAFDAFPGLVNRRNQLASTLSGGEQQMLSLARALIARPRLLLIDELSLGLAPKVVGELLAFVRTINAAGTSVVLVEQSVNVALSLVDHAYFMEKGEVRFDGPAADLLDRADLLRSVFLEGAAAAGAVR